MIFNDTTLYKNPNETEINVNRSSYGIQQLAKYIPQSQL